VWWAARQLRGGRAPRDVERTLLAVVVGAIALFLMMSTLPGQITHFQGFDDAQEMAGASLLARGYFPWRDLLFIHGLFGDVLTGSFGRAIFGDTIWGIFAFHSVILIPLTWVSAYLFAVWVSRRSAWFLALTFGVIGVARPLLELVRPLPDTQLPVMLLQGAERFALLPVVLIVLGETLRRRSAAWAVGLTLLLFVQEILVPETLFLAVPALACVVAADVVHRRPDRNLWNNLRLTRWCAIAGIAATAVWTAYLAVFGALRAFIDYYIVFGPGHNLAGAIPPSWVGPLEWAMIVVDIWCVLLTIWAVAIKMARRADWEARDWVAVAAAAFVALYLEKAFGRFDASHVWQVYGASLPLVLLWSWRLLEWLSPLFGAWWRGRQTWPARFGRFARPVTAAVVLALAVGLVYAGPLRKAAGQHYLAGVSDGSFVRLGYSAPGAIDTALLRDLDTTIRTYAGDGGPVFDMTSSLGYFYYVLGRAPGTRFTHIDMAIPEYSQRLLIGELKATRPPVVIYDAATIGLSSWDGITDNVRHYEVSEYVLRGWTPVLRTHGVLVMARNDLVDLTPPPALTTPPQTTDLYFRGPSCDWGATPNFMPVPVSAGDVTVPVLSVMPRLVVHFSGWAVDPITNRPASKVLIVDGDRVVGTTTPSIEWPDVAQYLHQDTSASGFEYNALLDTWAHPSSAYFVGADALAHPLGGSPAGSVVALRMPDGSELGVAPTVGGNLAVHNVNIRTIGEIHLPVGVNPRDYDLAMLSSTGGLGGSNVALTDEPGQPDHEISARWLDRTRAHLTLRVGSCPQWYGYDPSKPIFVVQDGGAASVSSVTLSAIHR
jgi:hypothetical protein